MRNFLTVLHFIMFVCSTVLFKRFVFMDIVILVKLYIKLLFFFIYLKQSRTRDNSTKE